MIHQAQDCQSVTPLPVQGFVVARRRSWKQRHLPKQFACYRIRWHVATRADGGVQSTVSTSLWVAPCCFISCDCSQPSHSSSKLFRRQSPGVHSQYLAWRSLLMAKLSAALPSLWSDLQSKRTHPYSCHVCHLITGWCVDTVGWLLLTFNIIN